MTPFPTASDPPRPREDNEQAPLGTHPTYDDVLDVAVQYTFPASDPIAVQASRGSQAPVRDGGREAGEDPDAAPGDGKRGER